MKCNMLLKLIFILYKQGREVKMRAVQDILWKIREEFINLKLFILTKIMNIMQIMFLSISEQTPGVSY